MQIRTIFPFTKDSQEQGSLFQWLRSFISELAAAVNGNISFGDGTDTDNVFGQWVTVADTGAANTEFAVAHTLGAVPPGFILMVPPASGYVYKGSSSWTTSNVYLKCSAANQAITVFVLSPAVNPV